MAESFSGAAFDSVWKSLDNETKQAIRDKARWEHMTLSAVIIEWWPELWDRVRTTGGAT